MSIPWRDRIATLLVATATLIYLLWLIGPLEGLTASSIAVLVLVLGFIASASAVVPGFAALLSGSRLYLALASLGGLVALACGVLTVTQATEHDACRPRDCDDRALGGRHGSAHDGSPSDRGRHRLTIRAIWGRGIVDILVSAPAPRPDVRSRDSGQPSRSDRGPGGIVEG